ncbi:hypothetical protein BH09ACT3_BH09ACT3_16340 [soil metagenome]
MALLAPTVQGPLSVLLPAAVVLGAVGGSTVRIYDAKTNSELGSAKVPTLTSGSISVSLDSGKTLPGGGAITATQEASSLDVSPHSPAVVVAPAPTTLPVPKFDYIPHRFADWMVVRGLVPGATVEISLGGSGSATLVGVATAVQPRQSIGARLPDTASINDTISVRQVVSLPGKPTLVSEADVAALADPPYAMNGAEHIIPSPSVLAMSDCTLAAPVTDWLEGLSLEVQIENPPAPTSTEGPYYYIEQTVNVVLGETAKVSTGLRARQGSVAFNEWSAWSTQVHPTDSGGPEAPIINGPVCADADVISLSNLSEGLEVSVFALQGAGSKLVERELGRATASGGTAEFNLPEGWAETSPLTPGGSDLKLKAVTRNFCGEVSAVAIISIDSLVSLGTPSFLPDPVGCALIAVVRNLTPGAHLFIETDEADSPLAEVKHVSAKELAIDLNRAALVGEKLRLRQVVCGSEELTASVTVWQGEAAELTLEVSGGLTSVTSSVTVDGMVIGGRIDLIVRNPNKQESRRTLGWAKEKKTSFSFTGLALDLQYEDRLSVVETMCEHEVGQSNWLTVQPGQLVVTQSPKHIVRSNVERTFVTLSAAAGHVVIPSQNLDFAVGLSEPVWFRLHQNSDPVAQVLAKGYIPYPYDVTWDIGDPMLEISLEMTSKLGSPKGGGSSMQFKEFVDVSWQMFRKTSSGYDQPVGKYGSATLDILKQKATVTFPLSPDPFTPDHYDYAIVVRATASVTYGNTVPLAETDLHAEFDATQTVVIPSISSDPTRAHTERWDGAAALRSTRLDMRWVQEGLDQLHLEVFELSTVDNKN